MTTIDIILLVCSLVLHILGLIGVVLPVLPSFPLSFAGMLLCCIAIPNPVMIALTVIFGIIAIICYILDYVAPSIITNKVGGSKYAVWGAAIGLVVGLFFPPLGIVIGPFLGAFTGELIKSRKFSSSLRVAAYTFLAFIISLVFKTTLCLLMFIVCIGDFVAYFFV